MSELETARLRLRHWKKSDAPALYALCLDPELRRCGVGSYDSVRESRRAIRLWRKRGDMWAVVRKEDNRLVGLVGLGDMNRHSRYKELEYAIAADCRGQGYATEALEAVLARAFGELDLLAVAAWVRSFNAPCVRVLEKCGFTHEGTLRRHARDQGDTLCYSILKEEQRMKAASRK